MNTIRVLIIDSDIPQRDVMRDFLEEHAFRVDVADNAKAGLRWFAQSQPDVVLCEVDGQDSAVVALLDEMRAGHKRVPVIVLSDETKLSYVVEILRAGAFDFITRPLPDLAVLLGTINAALDNISEHTTQDELELAFAELKYNRAELQQDPAMASLFQLGMLPDATLQLGPCRLVWQMNSQHPLTNTFFVDFFALERRYLAVFLVDLHKTGKDGAFVSGAIKVLLNEAARSYQEDRNLLLLHPQATLGWIFYYLRSLNLSALPGVCYTLFDTATNRLEWSDSGLAMGPLLWQGNETCPLAALVEHQSLVDGDPFPSYATYLAAHQPILFSSLDTEHLKLLANEYQSTRHPDGIVHLLSDTAEYVLNDTEQLSLVITTEKSAAQTLSQPAQSLKHTPQ